MIINGPMGVGGVQKLSTFSSGVVLILITLFLVLNLIHSRTGRAHHGCPRQQDCRREHRTFCNPL